MTPPLTIRTDLRAGDLGRVIELHGKVYDLLDGYGLSFEAFVGRTIAEFVLDNRARGQIWLAERGERLVGCSAIALREENRGQLRWVVVDPSERGQGIGKNLVHSALEYCRENACESVFLETTNGLPESQTLYEKLGFVVTSDSVEDLWDGPRPLIMMELSLKKA
jgi:GNAT superfamily N-acetyltransferase